MSKIHIASNVHRSGVTNKPLIVSILALIFLVSILPLFSLTSEATTVSLKLTPIRGVIGSSVTATGHGYVPGATVTLQFGSIIVGSQTANSTGGINMIFVVPQVASGPYAVTATDGMGDSTHSTFTVGSRAHITVKPTSGVAGITITITGKNFAYNSALTVKFNNKKLTTGISSSTGTFTLPITVPADALGSYAISVTDSLGYTGTAAFTIT